MDKVSGCSNNNAQVYAKQNSGAVQQTNDQACEAGGAANQASSAEEPKDGSEISVFNHNDDEAAEYGDYGYEGNFEAAGYSIGEDADCADPENVFAAGETDFAAETESVNAEMMSVGEISGDEYLQSPEYFQRLTGLIERQKDCRVLGQGQDLYDIIAAADENIHSKEEAKAYVDSRLQEVKEQCTGREASCMSMLTIQEIAADYGVKLPYGHPPVEGGLAKNIDPCVLSDCCLISSWAFNQGSDKEMYWMNVKQLRGYDTDPTNYKNKEVRIDTLYTNDYSELQAGDSLTNGTKHAMFILFDDAEAEVPDPKHPGQTYKGVIIVAEAADEEFGVRLRQLSYDEAKSRGYTGVDSSSVYDGTAACYNDDLKHH